MPEARDRRVVPVDEAAIYAANRIASAFFGSFNNRGEIGSGQSRGGGSATLIGRGRGRENTPLGTSRRGRGRGSTVRRSVLPSWYPRTPLRDVTGVVRAIERRRTRFGEEGQQLSDPSVPAAGAHIEHSASAISPNQVSVKLRTPAGCKVPKIMLDISTPSEKESELTPQKQLLNSIDAVEKIVREELQKLKRTPGARRVERQKRILMTVVLVGIHDVSFSIIKRVSDVLNIRSMESKVFGVMVAIMVVGWVTVASDDGVEGRD
ncbi:hypothetical protein RIF29_25078 [Crotalaria pallida]|uniref:Uncharacterized protein n=1 Tax=Crotalaria pallida TaxID=3830 RepID=A0AAN9EQY7_CROPI